MRKLPDAIFVIDPKQEEIAVKEARKLGVPVIAVIDSNCDPDMMDYKVPGNDDAIRAIRLFCSAIAEAIIEGKTLYEQSLIKRQRGRAVAGRFAGRRFRHRAWQREYRRDGSQREYRKRAPGKNRSGDDGLQESPCRDRRGLAEGRGLICARKGWQRRRKSRTGRPPMVRSARMCIRAARSACWWKSTARPTSSRARPSSRALLKDIAMQVAAANPRWCGARKCPPTNSRKKKRSTASRPWTSGKPEKVVEKIVEGKIERFYSEVCLMEQSFIKDPDKNSYPA